MKLIMSLYLDDVDTLDDVDIDDDVETELDVDTLEKNSAKVTTPCLIIILFLKFSSAIRKVV